MVAIPTRRLFAFIERTEEVHIRWEDAHSSLRDVGPPNVSVLTADGWRNIEPQYDPAGVPIWQATCRVGDVFSVSRRIRVPKNPGWDLRLEVAHWVVADGGQRHQMSPPQAAKYIGKRREFLRRLEAGENGGNMSDTVNAIVPQTWPPSAGAPETILESARSIAKVLADVVDQTHLAMELGGKRYVKVEGWTTLAAFMGSVVREVATEEHDGVYVSTVELVRLSDGQVLSRASAECGAPDELDRDGKPTWASRPRYARRSMAQTRAAGKACRLAYSWVMALAGYEPTPAEEIIDLPGGPMGTPKAEPPAQSGGRQSGGLRITEAQQRLIRARISAAGLPLEETVNRVKSHFHVEHLADLTRGQLDELLQLLPQWAAEKKNGVSGQDRLL